MANTSIDLVNLDFDAQKASLITYLRAQPQFRDYDFEGSNLNVLIDLLTYNTFKNAFYTNMALSEGFIDSAQLRPSILSHAKELNYLPRSTRSAKATVQIDFEATGGHKPYIIQKGLSFTAQVKNNSFIFTIPENLVVSSANNTYSFQTDIYEGSYVKESHIFDATTDLPLRFKLTNPNIDTDSITVNVYEDSQITGVIYKRAISLLDLDELSKVYFIQTSAVDGNYEVLFGDGVVGYQPKNGALVVIDYRLTSGEAANGSGRFSINFDPTDPFSELVGDVEVTTLAAATGGAEQEDIETTRFYAPRWFQTQERAVVPTDYSVLMKTEFPEIHAINVYGGEQLTPPKFGKVVVALTISNVQGLPRSKVDQYKKFLQRRCMLTVVPIFVQPDYTYIYVTTKVRYDVNVTAETSSRIQTIVLAAITDFNDQNLNDFEVTFRYSIFGSAIDNSDPSIVSNLTDITVYKKTTPVTVESTSINYDYKMELVNDLPPLGTSYDTGEETVLTSSFFTFNDKKSTFQDDNQGNVRIVQAIDNVTTVLATVGTIDYDTGIVSINDITLDSYDGATLDIHVQPRDRDVSCSLNTILAIEASQVNITVEQLQI